MSAKYTTEQHLKFNRTAWDEAHRNLAAKMKEKPNWGDEYRDGGHSFDDLEVELLGDISGLDVLQLSCAGDASQAFSLANMGANVTACDFSPVAIETARENAEDLGINVQFVVDDSQRLSTCEDNQFDFVHADYNLWSYEDLPLACRNWHRVLRTGGRLLLHEGHPITSWCLAPDEASGGWKKRRVYGDKTPEYYLGTDDGPPMAGSDLEAVEFPHTLADMMNAIFQSGLITEKMVERVRENGDVLGPSQGVLPSDFFVIARKEG